jgi:hypothetical protein
MSSEDFLYDAEISDYFFEEKSVPGPREVSSASLEKLFAFTISQDGANVACPTVVIQTSFLPNSDAGPTIEITFHFRHVLSFKASSPSLVKVGYTADYTTGISNGGMFFSTMYDYSYILGTGRTWKGQIVKLYLAVPWGTAPTLPRAFSRLARWKGMDIFLAQRYEPGQNDVISLKYFEMKADLGQEYYQNFWFDDPPEYDVRFLRPRISSRCEGRPPVSRIRLRCTQHGGSSARRLSGRFRFSMGFPRRPGARG